MSDLFERMGKILNGQSYKFTGHMQCPKCKGTGLSPDQKLHPCIACGGTGVFQEDDFIWPDRSNEDDERCGGER